MRQKIHGMPITEEELPPLMSPASNRAPVTSKDVSQVALSPLWDTNLTVARYTAPKPRDIIIGAISFRSRTH